LVLDDNRGIGVLFGPELSGKKTIALQFIRNLSPDISVAMIDGTRLNTIDLLKAILAEFDFTVPLDSVDHYWNALRVILSEKTRTTQAPLLILENLNKMYPSALYALCKLAELNVRGQYEVRMILMSDKAPFAVLHAPSMTAIAKRSISAFELGPMTLRESSKYLYTKLRASGSDDPDEILPVDIRNELHTTTGGWPGKLDSLAMQAIERAEEWPIRRAHLHPPTTETTTDGPLLTAVVEHSDNPEIQKLFLTLNGKTLEEIELADSKVLIGRSELCDVSIDSRFVSKHHALLVRTDDALHLLDLNSTNGTFVNSQRIQDKLLRHEDVVSIGNHGIKLICPAYRARPVTKEPDLAETTTMKTLEDLRRSRDQASEDIAPAVSRP
jgi:type II secretory pathway predicted ATPase ExeA